MGVPKLFKIIIDKFPKSHAKVENQPIDYLFIDFNSIIYESYEKIKQSLITMKTTNPKEFTKEYIEESIINKVIETNSDIIVNVVKPNKLVYFAFDGPPPRGKMIQQRDRRYKKMYESVIKHQLLNNYKVNNISIDTAYTHINEIHDNDSPIDSDEEDEESKENDSSEIWSTTNITPGTEFMLKMSVAMNKAIMEEFPVNLEYILSDASVAGEGEHKFLKYIDKLQASKICIYSNDGDVIMLVNRFPQHDTYILTRPKDTSRVVQKNYKDEKYIYIVVKGLNEGFVEQFNRLDMKKIDMNRLKTDYLFFTMLGGNDFVVHLYFLRMKEEHSFGVMKGIYQSVYEQKGYLTNEDLTINQECLMEYLVSLAKQETSWLRKKQISFNNSRISNNKKKDDKFKSLLPWEKDWEIFQHTEFYKSEHPLYEELKGEFKKIDYNLTPNILWKRQYYKEFFGVDYDDRKKIYNICYNYLKSWIYAFRYYLIEVPSWTWYYQYHTSPLPSDLVYTLKTFKDINKTFTFEKGEPYKPLEQLMLILPKKTDLLDEKFIKIMDKYPMYYPEKFKFDVLWGGKFIYSEPVLKNINADLVLKDFSKIKLTKKEKELNTLQEFPLFYGHN